MSFITKLLENYDKNKVISLGIGVLLFCLTFLFTSLKYVFQNSNTVVSFIDTTLKVSEVIIPSSGQTVNIKKYIKLIYPEKIPQNESHIIQLIVTTEVMGVAAPIKIDSAIGIRLLSSGFKIDPSAFILKRKGQYDSLDFSWTIFAEKTGVQELLLDISELRLRQDDSAILVANGGAVKYSTADFYPVKIEILTLWGISQKTFNMIKYIVGLLGFILCLPFLKSFFEDKIKTQRQVFHVEDHKHGSNEVKNMAIKEKGLNEVKNKPIKQTGKFRK
jgi:hypothetical protein